MPQTLKFYAREWNIKQAQQYEEIDYITRAEEFEKSKFSMQLLYSQSEVDERIKRLELVALKHLMNKTERHNKELLDLQKELKEKLELPLSTSNLNSEDTYELIDDCNIIIDSVFVKYLKGDA